MEVNVGGCGMCRNLIEGLAQTSDITCGTADAQTVPIAEPKQTVFVP